MHAGVADSGDGSRFAAAERGAGQGQQHRWHRLPRHIGEELLHRARHLERVIITNNDAGNSQTVANVMEVNTSGGRAKIVAGYGNRNPSQEGWTLKTTTDQAHIYEKESGLNVVGGVNASWFNINTGRTVRLSGDERRGAPRQLQRRLRRRV